MPPELSDSEREYLLDLARRSIASAVNHKPLPEFDLQSLPKILQEPGVCFITLTQGGELRGCIGALEPYQSLVEDVCEHAVAAALHDYRFLPVQPDELDNLKIEISRLTPPQPIKYDTPDDLPRKLRPGIDGVILRYGSSRATFLPQVWEKISEPDQFLGHLCVKMGYPENEWKRQLMDVSVYQVEEFHE